MPEEVSTLGAVYTQRWVAELLLDRIGYVDTVDLTRDVLVEPCCGDGAFAVPVVERLLRSARNHGVEPDELSEALAFVDVDADAVTAGAAAVTEVLVASGVAQESAAALVRAWFRVADFLLDEVTSTPVRWVVGNPPYLRIEDVPESRRRAYRQRWSSMSGRADVYIGFWQAGLALLGDGGRIGYICADRWLRNQYGTTLRTVITERHRVELVLDLHDVAAFQQKVDAYPAMVVLAAGLGEDPAAVGKLSTAFEAAHLPALKAALTSGDATDTTAYTTWKQPQHSFRADGWVLAPSGGTGDVGRLAELLPSLPDTGVTIRGGLATGADDIFIVRGDVDVESELLRRVVGPSDFIRGELVWSGRRLVFPWTATRQLVDLDRYPRLKSYLAPHEMRLRERHVVRTRRLQDGWWRTIDREPVDGYSGDALLIPDIRERVEPVLDTDRHVPMHSLYRLTSNVWDLETLGAVLMSDLVHQQMKALSIAMASGRMRVSAQYLKRLRLPPVEWVQPVAEELRAAFRDRDRARSSALVDAILRDSTDR